MVYWSIPLASVQIIPLGGMGEIGKNMYLIQYKDEIIIIDCGLKFPDESLPGIDLIIPDFSYILENKEKVKGIFLTHGHEDHIGGIPYLLRHILVPIYGSPLTNGLVKAKAQEHPILRNALFHNVNEDSHVFFQNLSVSFFRTNHSISNSLGMIVHTPEGLIIHTGDFKFDLSSPHSRVDFYELTRKRKQPVLALLSDSTNSEREGYTPSDQTVGQSMDGYFRDATQRIFLATFASNVHRIQQVIETAEKYGKKVVFMGRSMERILQVGLETGHIQTKEGTIIKVHQMKQYKDKEIVILCTGSQGEPNAALTRLANGSHRQLQVLPGDTVIYLLLLFQKLIDQLMRLGAEVVYGSGLDIHASGHGSKMDLLLMLNLIRPQYFVPIHGEYRMLVFHFQLAKQTGIPDSRIFILENGQSLHLSSDIPPIKEKVSSGQTFVDGAGVGDI
jgi:ribonuclease J